MKIYFASDHAGFELKEKLEEFVQHLDLSAGKARYEIEDLGPFTFNADDDYPDFIIPCAQKVAEDKTAVGIVIGGSGQGEAITANKIKGIRAVVLYDYNEDIVKLSREHNDANVLSLGARFISEENAKKAVKLWLETKFSNEERHKRRIEKIKNYELKNYIKFEP
ncbi:MAG: RpiB/LacA/LacB family sugar-phosphate isomerase [Parcubacteria group bacterium]|nr:RpiB/LacA/LacB family sugar-phosphate isomerase [Parcubacteria group bacterium]